MAKKKETTGTGKSDFDAYIERIEATAGQKKLWSYLHGLPDEDWFVKRIAELRRQYKLPDNGLEDYIYYKRDGKEYVGLPDFVNGNTLWDDAIKLTEELALDTLWASTVQHFIVYNNWAMSSMGTMFTSLDLNSLLNGPYEEYVDAESELDLAKSFAKDYPIAVFVNPYASQRDLIDYIKKTFKAEIEPLLKPYRKPEVKIGKRRKRNDRVQARNRFIRANAHLPYKEIVRIIADNTGEVLDYTYIAKIVGSKKKK